jgi:hypothetical protein
MPRHGGPPAAGRLFAKLKWRPRSPLSKQHYGVIAIAQG